MTNTSDTAPVAVTDTQGRHGGNNEDLGNTAVTGSDSSVNTVECRICSQSEKESGKALSVTGCLCHGDIAKVHVECLQRWIDSRYSNQCEICNGQFRLTVTPHAHNMGQFQTAHDFQGDLRILGNPHRPQLQSQCSGMRRSWFMVIEFVILLSTIVAFMLTMDTSGKNIPAMYEHVMMTDMIYTIRNNMTDAAFTHQVATYQLSFNCIILVFSVLLWVFAEIKIWPLERLVFQSTNDRPRRPRDLEDHELQMVLEQSFLESIIAARNIHETASDIQMVLDQSSLTSGQQLRQQVNRDQSSQHDGQIDSIASTHPFGIEDPEDGNDTDGRHIVFTESIRSPSPDYFDARSGGNLAFELPNVPQMNNLESQGPVTIAEETGVTIIPIEMATSTNGTQGGSQNDRVQETFENQMDVQMFDPFSLPRSNI